MNDKLTTKEIFYICLLIELKKKLYKKEKNIGKGILNK